MPTGYTANIAKGISFEQYALNCARAFGALIDMRDAPSDAEIPEAFEPSDYHIRKLEDAKNQELFLLSMSISEADKAAKMAHSDAEQSRTERLREIYELKAKYDAMRENAMEWEPPTPDHEKLKEFMIEQIESSIRFDCDTDYYKTPIPPMSGNQWLEQQLASVRHSIECHQEEHKEELHRVERRNAWLKALRESLNQERSSK